MRAAALGALTQLSHSRAVPALIGALQDSDEQVRLYAVNLLTGTTGQPFGEDAAKWREWWEGQGHGQPAERLGK